MTPAEYGAFALALLDTDLCPNERAVAAALPAMNNAMGTRHITVKATFDEIASKAGMSRATAVRTVAKLDKRGMVTRAGGAVLVLNVAVVLGLEVAQVEPPIGGPAQIEPIIGHAPTPAIEAAAQNEPVSAEVAQVEPAQVEPIASPSSPDPTTPASASSAGAHAHVKAEPTESDVQAELIRRGGGQKLTEIGEARLYRWSIRGYPAARIMHGLKAAATPDLLGADGCWRDEAAALRYATGAIERALPHEWQPGVERTDKRDLVQAVGPARARGDRFVNGGGYGLDVGRARPGLAVEVDVEDELRRMASRTERDLAVREAARARAAGDRATAAELADLLNAALGDLPAAEDLREVDLEAARQLAAAGWHDEAAALLEPWGLVPEEQSTHSNTAGGAR